MWESTFKRFNAFKHLALRYLIWGIKLSFLSNKMPRNLDSTTTGIGDPYKCKTGSSCCLRNSGRARYAYNDLILIGYAHNHEWYNCVRNQLKLGHCMRTWRDPNKRIDVITCMLNKIIFFSATLEFSTWKNCLLYSNVIMTSSLKISNILWHLFANGAPLKMLMLEEEKACWMGIHFCVQTGMAPTRTYKGKTILTATGVRK